MQLDNSGPSVSFDEKTTQAIEEGKNRLTLLAAEEHRLKKLTGTLTNDILKLENDLAHKTDKLKSLDKELETVTTSFTVKQALLDDVEATLASTEATIKQKEATIQGRETACAEKEQLIAQQLMSLSDAQRKVAMEQAKATIENEAIEEKKKQIESFLSKL